jgi:hypothetical protein
MFFGKGADDFTKHLPDEALHTLARKGDNPQTSVLMKIASIGREPIRGSQKVETFDAGPNLLTSEDQAAHELVEIAVDHDSLMGDDDEIELSVRYYKNGELQELPVIPSLTFTMTQEKEVWRLKEVTAAAHVPLTDPDYLKCLRKEQDEINEGMIKMRFNMIVAGETAYAKANPDAGYSCDLSKLSDPGQGAEEWNGYRFTISECKETPARKYRLLAVPMDSESEAKIFCADESGKVKFLKGTTASRCFAQGEEIQPPPEAPASENEPEQPPTQ